MSGRISVRAKTAVPSTRIIDVARSRGEIISTFKGMPVAVPFASTGLSAKKLGSLSKVATSIVTIGQTGNLESGASRLAKSLEPFRPASRAQLAVRKFFIKLSGEMSSVATQARDHLIESIRFFADPLSLTALATPEGVIIRGALETQRPTNNLVARSGGSGPDSDAETSATNYDLVHLGKEGVAYMEHSKKRLSEEPTWPSLYASIKRLDPEVGQKIDQAIEAQGWTRIGKHEIGYLANSMPRPPYNYEAIIGNLTKWSKLRSKALAMKAEGVQLEGSKILREYKTGRRYLYETNPIANLKILIIRLVMIRIHHIFAQTLPSQSNWKAGREEITKLDSEISEMEKIIFEWESNPFLLINGEEEPIWREDLGNRFLPVFDFFHPQLRQK